MQSINEILTEAITLKASDIHITVGVPVMIRLRGELRPLNDDVLAPSIVTALVHEIIPQDHFESFQENYQLDFSHSIPGVSRFRVNAYYQRGQMALAIRPIPNKIPTFEELELPPILKAFMDKPRGLVLVTGPTGSGKSTTLAAMINYVNQNAHKHIITLEDPIEFQHKHNKCVINQREIGSDVKDFNSALRVALRQDPDIILVGEMRDLETIQIALTAAETGHLVIGTLHTSSAASTIERIIDVFPAEKQTQIRMQLAGSLVGVVAQRLFKRQDSDGRKAVCEIMVNTPAIANLIRQEKVYQIPSVIQTSKEMGMQTMEMAIKEQMMYGVIGMEDAKAYLE
ncbi:type IV pilus twitching motility protein PilT [Turicibacter sanguinis]|uniref:Twitching motility protein n=1 Tax=Turicibacter sanguinis PC909 TaxID=702450 RepID=A0ABN0A255_9FIRM|nr:type IV pilus twitching motility protein PilT [Turicibacter sanguinis]EFF63788.1 twitching motility protein [Turicibacter sanguinis PC909]MCU7191481.1 type IV pilus twitching motility protein PilT [Turicibacter sanguinis]MDB8540396.1 type IV pilus twitching motility protein PilT [Turicibacter sanguinis]MDB8545007.1 type IV pilus twitching motility protein PilT [Turicibacter sanguinis]MTK71056.1 PilT/PilU family type 4a pilus ATPase [Turicibacter sanguinis]